MFHVESAIFGTVLRVNYPVAGLIRFYETSEIAFRNERRFEEKDECI